MRDRITVQEAARRLGVKDDAIRKRIQRGSIEHDKGPDGRVFVYLDATHDLSDDKYKDTTNGSTQGATYVGYQDTAYDASSATTQAAVVLVEEMRDRIASLERMLDEEREARTEERRRHDTLMVTLLQRIPELEAPLEPRDVPETTSEGPGRGDVAPAEPQEHISRASWWRRFFFGP
jgi:excisionase family DNA binding protein